MPNWCTNRLTLTGDEAEIKKLLSLIQPNHKDDEFSFEAVLPLPQVLTVPMEGPASSVESFRAASCGYGSAYDFRVAVWGTKWEPSDVTYYPDGHIFCFDTAWSPAGGVYTKLSELFPNVEIHVEAIEPGCGYACDVILSKGSVVDDYSPASYSKEYYELMFDLCGGGEDYDYDPKIDNYVLKEDY